MATTRLGLLGVPWRPYGTFGAKGTLIPTVPGLEWTLDAGMVDYTLASGMVDFTLDSNKTDWTIGDT